MRDLPAARIVAAIADAAARWTDADYPVRVRAVRAVIERTGYTEPVVDFALDRLFEDLTRERLEAAIAREVGSLAALDGFMPRDDGTKVHFRGLDAVTIVSSSTTVGVAIAPLAFALAAKCNVLVKDRADRLVTAFAETLLEECPEIFGALTVECWSNRGDPQTRERIFGSDAVVAFGGSDALQAIRALMRPDARFLPFGHRTSVGYIAREALSTEISAAAAAVACARDIVLYDGEGCLSVHALFVEAEGGASVARFTRLLCDALEISEREFPSERARDDDAVAYERATRFRAAQGDGSVFGGAPAATFVALDPPRSAPPPLVPQTLAVYSVTGPPDALVFLRAHRLPLEGFALSDLPREDVVAAAVASGASRIAPLGTLQTPTVGSEHGGTPRILPFVRAIVQQR